MGVDLKLHPIMYDTGQGAIWTHVGLELERRRELWGPIEAIEKPLGRKLAHYDDDTGVEEVEVNPYGLPLTCATAGDLAKVIGEFNDQDPHVDPWNKAAAAYLGALPPDVQVVLWWH